MAALAAVLLMASIHAARPSLAPQIPKMTAPVVNVKSQRQKIASTVPLLDRVLPHDTVTSLGSGVIIDRRGLVLTNAHIVKGVRQVQVQLADERELTGEVVGRDKDLDLALVRLHADEPLPVAELGRSSRMRVGDYVVAVGNPYGLQHTVTSGIVSARGRVLGVGPEAPLLQTDASINPGNSGGPLYDLDGRVIGLNTAIVAGAHGIGFAVPIDLVRRALPQLEHAGKVTRGSAGVHVGRVPRELAEALRAPHDGALVSAVEPDGPGARAGLQPGDVIVRWDGVRVDAADALPALMSLSPPGTLVRVEWVRSGAWHKRHLQMGKAE